MIPVSLWALGFLFVTKEFWPTTQDIGKLTMRFQRYWATGCRWLIFFFTKLKRCEFCMHVSNTLYTKIFEQVPKTKSPNSKSQREACPFCFSTPFLPGIINNISHMTSNVGGLHFERTFAKESTLFCFLLSC